MVAEGTVGNASQYLALLDLREPSIREHMVNLIRGPARRKMGQDFFWAGGTLNPATFFHSIEELGAFRRLVHLIPKTRLVPISAR